jgi:hypothetical protein
MEKRPRNKKRHPARDARNRPPPLSEQLAQLAAERDMEFRRDEYVLPPERASMSDLESGCEKYVVPSAKTYFRAELPRLRQLHGDERLRNAFFVHRDSVCVPFLEHVNESLFNMPLTDHDDYEWTSSFEMLPWIVEIITDQAHVFGMSEQEFGAFMASGFAHLYNEAVRENNAIVSRRPQRRRGPLGRARDFHDFYERRLAMPPQQRAADSTQTEDLAHAQQMASLWRKFCFAYSLYDSLVARDLRS